MYWLRGLPCPSIPLATPLNIVTPQPTVLLCAQLGHEFKLLCAVMHVVVTVTSIVTVGAALTTTLILRRQFSELNLASLRGQIGSTPTRFFICSLLHYCSFLYHFTFLPRCLRISPSLSTFYFLRFHFYPFQSNSFAIFNLDSNLTTSSTAFYPSLLVLPSHQTI